MDTKTHSSTEILSWSAPIRPHYQRGKGWYICAAIVALAILAYSIVTGAWSFTLVLVLALGLYIYVHKTEPDAVKISIKTDGFQFGDEFVPWFDCEGFWVIEKGPYTTLHIERKTGRMREYVILTAEQDSIALRRNLQELITELTDRHERLLDTIARICKL